MGGIDLISALLSPFKKFNTKDTGAKESTKAAGRRGGRDCCKIVIRGQGPDGVRDAQSLYALPDTGATANCITKTKLAEVMGREDAYIPHRNPISVKGIEGSGKVQSIGFAYLLFYFEVDKKKIEYVANFEVLDDAHMGPERCNLDLILGRGFLQSNKLITLSDKLAVRLHRISSHYQ